MRSNVCAAITVAGVMAIPVIGLGQQFTNPGAGGWWHTTIGGTPALTNGVAIGNVGVGPYPSAFQVRGELLPAANQTPEVFRTTAPITGSTYWRMFQGGTTAGFERGQLFADPSSTHFNINAPQGHLRLLTNTTERARINASGSYTIGSFTGQVASGFLGVSPNSTLWTGGNPGPFSRLHLHDGTSVQSASYRPWMKNGVTFTGNQDHSFLGQKSAAVDYTDMVLHWSDNPGVTLKDRLRFIFTSGYSSIATSGAQSTEGLEAMRIFPARYEEAYIGFGDFYAANLANPLITEPTERVDMVNGRLRIRQLPSDAEHTGPYKVMVVDDSPAPSAERGVVKWATLPTNPGGADCKWTLLGTGNANIATAYAGNPGCPQYDRFVGIGTNAPSAKLHVKWTGTSGDAHASNFVVDGTSYGKRGADLSVLGTGSLHAGLRAIASGASSSSSVEGNMGVHARAEGTVSVARNRGLFSEALVTGSSTVVANMGLEVVSDCNASTTVSENYGVRAVARTFGASTTNYGGLFSAVADDANATVYGIKASAAGGAAASRWAGWFDGNVNLQNGNLYINEVFQISDAALKTGIDEVTPSTSVIDSLQVRSYAYSNTIDPTMQLPDGQRIGLIAQEVEQLLPHLVSQVSVVPRLDSAGVAEHAGYSYKTINYVGLIPYLISAVQKLTKEHAQLRAQLAACCANTGSDHRMAPAIGGADADEPVVGQDRLLHIAPNPFTERTTLYCTLERSGRMQLLANSADGRDLRVLSEAQREAGEYQYEWSTENLAPGVYYITLLLDGEPVVKKAVKVGR